MSDLNWSARSSTDPGDLRRVIEATASLLDTEPGLTNLQLLRRLAGVLGARAVAELPVNRFERQVREPAKELLRTGHYPPARGRPLRPRARKASENQAQGEVEGTPATMKTKRAAPVPRNAARPRNPGPAKGRPSAPGARDRLRAELEAAITEAFALGAEAGSRAETVKAFRQMVELRDRVGRRI